MVGGKCFSIRDTLGFTFIKGAQGVIPSIFLLFHLVKPGLIIHLYALCFGKLYH